MLFFSLFLWVCVIAAASADLCDYVYDNGVMTNATAVRDCFNSHVLPDGLIETIINQLDAAGMLYPYIEIASNPPNSPSPGYFEKVNFTSEFEKLKTVLRSSGGITSKVYRPLIQFITKFHDAHFSLTSSYTEESMNLFSYIECAFPFWWTPLGEKDGKIQVELTPTVFTAQFFPNMSEFLLDKIRDGVYVKTIDGKDAFEFFRDFFSLTNSMKSKQGKLFLSRLFTGLNKFTLTSYPLNDEDFNEHTVVFSDNDNLKFNLFFYNPLFVCKNLLF